MSITQTEKEEILRTFLIELERMFAVVSGQYHRLNHSELFISEVETKLKTSLASISALNTDNS
jgi:hypothetical protein